MKIQIYNKLIRDRIPELIQANGQQAVVRTLSDTEFLSALKHKLTEEVAEFNASEEIEELADILEVVVTLAHYLGANALILDQLRAEKQQKRGGFRNRLFLEKITFPYSHKTGNL